MKRVVVTGASGFIGNACIESLLENGQYEIHAVSKRDHNRPHPRVNWHLLDLHDHQASRKLLNSVKPSHLLHLAWYATPGKFWFSDENYRWVETSFALLKAFYLAGGKRCVTAGSCAEYLWDNSVCHEDVTPLTPSTIYGECKKSLYTMQKDFCDESGLSCAWGRVFHLYGPHEPQQKLVSSIIISLINGKQAECSHGDLARDYLYVKDVASAFVALLDSRVEGAVNITSGQPVALREIILKIGDKLDRTRLIRFGNRPPAENIPAIITGAVERIMNDVGWQPVYNLDNGIDLTIEWWKNQTKKEQR